MKIISVDRKLTCPSPELSVFTDELTLGVSEFVKISLVPSDGESSLVHLRFLTQSGLRNIVIFSTFLNSCSDYVFAGHNQLLTVCRRSHSPLLTIELFAFFPRFAVLLIVTAIHNPQAVVWIPTNSLLFVTSWRRLTSASLLTITPRLTVLS